MDALSVGAPQLSPARHFEQLSDVRAEKRERLRGRNNVTSCRSPTRDLDTREIKNKLRERRQEEFLRRRSLSPRPGATESANASSGRKPPPDAMRQRRSETPQADAAKRPAANGRPTMILTPNGGGADEAPGTSKQEPSRSEEETPEPIPAGSREKKQASASEGDVPESNLQRVKGRPRKQRGQKVSIQTEAIFQNPRVQSQVRVEKKTLENSGMRTEPGFVLVRESDIERLADYLEEALWREDSAKQKLAALQQSTSHLMNSSDAVWTSRFSEDLLRGKIKALEAQLHVCLQTFPPEGMKKLALQTEKQRLVFEEKALEALQRATWEKAEALSRADTLQKAVEREKAEAQRWRSRYEELKLSSGRLEQDQHLNHQQLQQQLRSQVELSSAREDELQEELSSLRQDKRELQYNMCLLEEDNQTLREEIQQLRDGGDEIRDQQDFLLEEKVEPRLSVRRDTRLEEQLRQSEEKLQLQQTECEELQTELDVMKQECHSSQVRLSQCREELRKLSHRRRTRTPCGSWWSVYLLSFLLLAVAGVAMLCLCHPPFREQAEDLYADVWTRVEGYLVEVASSRHPGCFKPI